MLIKPCILVLKYKISSITHLLLGVQRNSNEYRSIKYWLLAWDIIFDSLLENTTRGINVFLNVTIIVWLPIIVTN